MYRDCEHPPTILHGRTELSVDDQGIIVTAVYQCEPNFKLIGQAQLICDTDTDEWQGDLPECTAADGADATGSETPQVDPTNSPPDVPGGNAKQPAESDDEENENEIATTLPPTKDNNEAVESASSSPDPVAQPKEKVYTTPEDKGIDIDFASRLDNSCTTEGISAPAIEDSFVREYT